MRFLKSYNESVLKPFLNNLKDYNKNKHYYLEDGRLLLTNSIQYFVKLIKMN